MNILIIGPSWVGDMVMAQTLFQCLRQRHPDCQIDVLAERFAPRTRLRIELAGLLLLFLCFCAVVIWYSVPYVATSFQLHETSAAPGGLPYRWFLKSFLVTGFALLALAGLGRLTRVWAALRQR